MSVAKSGCRRSYVTVVFESFDVLGCVTGGPSEGSMPFNASSSKSMRSTSRSPAW